ARKGDVLGKVEELAHALLKYADLARGSFGKLAEKAMSEPALAAKLQSHTEEVRNLYLSCSDIPFGPPDTHEVVEVCGLLGGSVDELFDSYSARSMEERNATQRRVRFEVAERTLQRDLKRWEAAWEKVHHG